MENGDLFVTWMAAGKNDDWQYTKFHPVAFTPI